jgi:hypothetical protein
MVNFTVDTISGRVSGVAKKIVAGVETILDLDTEVATTELIFTMPPNDTEMSPVTASITTPASGDGAFFYQTSGNFFSQSGKWKVKAKYTLTGGEILISDPPVEFNISP